MDKQQRVVAILIFMEQAKYFIEMQWNFHDRYICIIIIILRLHDAWSDEDGRR